MSYATLVPDQPRTAPASTDREAEDSGVRSTAAIAGHPLHPMLVPFPIAFLASTLATDLAYETTGDPFWARTSCWLLGAGIAAGAVAGVAGATDFLTIERARSSSVGKFHAAGNAVALTLAGANLAARLRHGRDHVPKGGLAASAVTAVLLMATGWAGGELAYRHKIGVIGNNRADQEPDWG